MNSVAQELRQHAKAIGIDIVPNWLYHAADEIDRLDKEVIFLREIEFEREDTIRFLLGERRKLEEQLARQDRVERLAREVSARDAKALRKMGDA